jgi:hypothetical protein
MKTTARLSVVRLWLTCMIIALAGCATQLAPSYDKVVAEGLVAANTEAMTLLATTSQGTSASTFSQREEKYNALIGKFDALAIQAGARPVPKSKASESINRILAKRGADPLTDDDATPPSVEPIKMVAQTLTKMRDTDKKQGITATESAVFKGQISIYLDQATTYENFLQR